MTIQTLNTILWLVAAAALLWYAHVLLDIDNDE